VIPERIIFVGRGITVLHLLFRQFPLLKPLSRCELCVPPVETIHRCLYLPAFHTHRSYRQQSLKIPTSRYGPYDRMTTVRFSVGVVFFYFLQQAVQPWRPFGRFTQRMQRTISRGMRTKRDADNCPAHTPLVKSTWSFTCISPYISMAWCIINYEAAPAHNTE
jgi:hypothetical protein